MKIAIATPTLVENDAVGNDVMGMYFTLSKAGHDVKLYADGHDIRLPCNQLKHLNNCDTFIYHHSVSCETGVRKFKELACRKILKYHNITPPHFFAPYSEPFNACSKGLQQITELLAQPCEVWVDSEFNGLHLQEFRSASYKVIPPFNQVDMLNESETDHQSVISFSDWNTNIIVVGRVSSNKNIIKAVEAFAEYTKHDSNSRLIIVGVAWGDYSTQVAKRAEALGVQDKVLITGKLPLSTLKSFYLVADVLLITSQHEGFCVPMVEAMAFNVPVVSVKACALPYTGGDAVQFTDDDPVEIAVNIKHALANRIDLIKKGHMRFKNNFQNSRISGVILGSVNSTQAK